VTDLREAWELARERIKRARECQQKSYKQRAQLAPLRVGDRVFLHVPSAKWGKAHKFASPFHGPYCVIHLYENGANIHVCPVEHPQQAKVLVSLSWLRKCPREFPGSDGDPVPEAPADTGSGIGKDHIQTTLQYLQLGLTKGQSQTSHIVTQTVRTRPSLLRERGSKSSCMILYMHA